METLLYDQNVELTTVETMKALVFHGPGQKSWEDKPVPTIKAPTDAIVKIYKTTICGTDLHILRGEYPVKLGLIIGHEPVGVIEELGAGVTGYQVGDRVLVDRVAYGFTLPFTKTTPAKASAAPRRGDLVVFTATIPGTTAPQRIVKRVLGPVPSSELDAQIPVLSLPEELGALAEKRDDPSDPIDSVYGRNAWKSRMRAHPDVAAVHGYAAR